MAPPKAPSLAQMAVAELEVRRWFNSRLADQSTDLARLYRNSRDIFTARLRLIYEQFLAEDPTLVRARAGPGGPAIEATIQRTVNDLSRELGERAIRQMGETLGLQSRVLNRYLGRVARMEFRELPISTQGVLNELTTRVVGGGTFMDRMFHQTDALRGDLYTTLRQSLLNGDDFDTVRRKVHKLFGVDKLKDPEGPAYGSVKIYRNEALRQWNLLMGEKADETGGIEVWWATLDERSTPGCVARHGRKISEVRVRPPRHFNCRCQVLVVPAGTDLSDALEDANEWLRNHGWTRRRAAFQEARVPVVTAEWDPAEHPRDPEGKFAVKGTGQVQVGADGRGQVERDDEGREWYGGVRDDEWNDWTGYSAAINDAVAGQLKPGQIDDQGQMVTAEDVRRWRDLGDRIQDAAASNVVEHPPSFGQFYRGESYSSEEDFRARYRPRAKIATDRLTSVSTDREAALQYAEEGLPVHVLVTVTGKHGIRGIQTAPLGVPSNEVIMPKAAEFRVARIRRGGPGWIVDLYSTEPHKGLPRVDASRPPAVRASHVESLREARIPVVTAEWDPAEHPRDPEGKFAEKPGGTKDLTKGYKGWISPDVSNYTHPRDVSHRSAIKDLGFDDEDAAFKAGWVRHFRIDQPSDPNYKPHLDLEFDPTSEKARKAVAEYISANDAGHEVFFDFYPLPKDPSMRGSEMFADVSSALRWLRAGGRPVYRSPVAQFLAETEQEAGWTWGRDRLVPLYRAGGRGISLSIYEQGYSSLPWRELPALAAGARRPPAAVPPGEALARGGPDHVLLRRAGRAWEALTEAGWRPVRPREGVWVETAGGFALDAPEAPEWDSPAARLPLDLLERWPALRGVMFPALRPGETYAVRAVSREEAEALTLGQALEAPWAFGEDLGGLSRQQLAARRAGTDPHLAVAVLTEATWDLPLQALRTVVDLSTGRVLYAREAFPAELLAPYQRVAVLVPEPGGGVWAVRPRGRDFWTLPGGHLNPGETPAEAAVREMLEETGVDVEVIQSLGPLHRPWSTTEVLLARRVGRSQDPLTPAEIDAVHVIPLETLEPSERGFVGRHLAAIRQREVTA